MDQARSFAVPDVSARVLRTVLSLLGSLMVLVGCASSPTTNYYVLTATAAQAPIATDLRIGVGPVELPSYLDRDTIVTRGGSTSLDVAEFDRWAEPLDEAFARVLSENLSRRFGTDAVFVHPWGARTSLQMRIPVRIVRFDSRPNGDAALVALWSILGPQQDVLVTTQRSVIDVAAADPGYAATTTALSRAVDRLAQEIAKAVPEQFTGWKLGYDAWR